MGSKAAIPKGRTGQQTSIYDASMAYQAAGVPLVVFGGIEYGAGSSRDWAAKGTNLLGVKAVIVQIKCRIDTEVEIEYVEHGGVLHYVLRNLAQG